MLKVLRRKILIILFLVFATGGLYVYITQSRDVSPDSGISEKVLSSDFSAFGVIRHKGWEKSMQSYCSQGSDWFLLEADSGEEYVLKYDEKLLSFADKQVEVKGNLLERKIIDPNLIDKGNVYQAPKGDVFTCELVEVEFINDL